MLTWDKDGYGRLIYDHYRGMSSGEVIERDDGWFGVSAGVYLRDAQQEIQGGLLGRTGNSALFIESLWVAEPLRRRGHGKQLVLTAEGEALRRGCHFSHVDTYSFHAPDFHRRLGYEVFGVLDGYKSGHTRYFLKKPLASGA